MFFPLWVITTYFVQIYIGLITNSGQGCKIHFYTKLWQKNENRNESKRERKREGGREEERKNEL